jgi:hypothetical protein
MKLRWLANPSVSCYYATDCLLRKRPLVDAGVTEVLAGPATALARSLAVDAVLQERFLQQLVPLAASAEGKRELAQQILTRTDGRGRAEFLGLKYRGHLVDLDTAFKGELPRLDAAMPVAVERWKEEWYRHGPGLLAEVTYKSEDAVLASEAAVLLVHPVRGGGGCAYLAANAVCVEAVATDPVAELPEVLRLVWLLSQLNLDLPRYSDLLPNARRLGTVGALAMLPITLAAAGELKLISCDERAIGLAVRTWLQPDDAETVAGRLSQWWEVYRDTRPPLATALAALDRMIG